jgi:hypothetical protein
MLFDMINEVEQKANSGKTASSSRKSPNPASESMIIQQLDNDFAAPVCSGIAGEIAAEFLRLTAEFFGTPVRHFYGLPASSLV